MSESAPALAHRRVETSRSAGARFTLSATVRNQGAARSDSTTLRYYQSADSTSRRVTITDSPATLSTYYYGACTDSTHRTTARLGYRFGAAPAPDLDPPTVSESAPRRSSSGDESVSLTAPDSPGTYYYGACVDEVSSELDTQNNCSAGVQVTVGAAPAPDLVVDPTLPRSARARALRRSAGATTSPPLHDTERHGLVRNQGAGGAASASTYRTTAPPYYQSPAHRLDHHATGQRLIGDTEVGTDSVFAHRRAESR